MTTRLVYLILLATLSIIVFLSLVTLGQPVTITKAAPAGAPLLQDATPTLAPTPPPQTLPTQYSGESVLLVFLILLLLGGLFVLLLWWSNKLDQTSYLALVYKDTIEKIEYGRLATGLREKWEKGEYHREAEEDGQWLEKNPQPEPPADLPEAYYYYDSNWGASAYSTSAPSSDWPTPSSGEAEAIQKYQQALRVWRRVVDREAKRRHHQELDLCRDQARRQANSAISIDLGVLQGRGSEFVLEFTTVVVIIFAAVMLGVLHILDTQQIGTLLAAIAGYVLGRATTRARSGSGEVAGAETETRIPVKTNELGDLLRAVSGTTPTTTTPTAPTTPTTRTTETD